MKIYRDRDWLWEHYIVREESSSIIAWKAGCDPSTICDWLHKLSIPIRINNGLWQDQSWLQEHYVRRGESSIIMAKEAGCSQSAIKKWLHKYGIPVRGGGEGIFLAKRNSVVITPDLLEFLKGEIVGDGYIGMAGNRSARYQHSSKYREYVTWLSKCFNERGIEQVGRITDRKDEETGAITYRYTSRSYPELVPIYKRWYPNGKKTVPKDLRLTPIIARQWYLGDGGFSDYKIKCPGIKLSTCDFDQQSIGYLLEELDRLGFKATRQPSDNTIRIWVRSVPDFLKWIGPCPISCYDYKWDYLKNA